MRLKEMDVDDEGCIEEVDCVPLLVLDAGNSAGTSSGNQYGNHYGNQYGDHFSTRILRWAGTTQAYQFQH